MVRLDGILFFNVTYLITPFTSFKAERCFFAIFSSWGSEIAKLMLQATWAYRRSFYVLKGVP
jgi:hypothetical protein